MAACVVRVLEAVRARAPRDRLPIVIPVVLHHGAGGWRAPRSLRELYEADADLFEALGERALHSAVLHYLLIVRKVEDPALLLAAAREHGGPELEEIAMSAFDRVKAEGKAEGRAEGKAELVLRMLRLRFGELPSALVEHVAAASPDALDAMADRILAAKTPQDVIA